jgi:hypothetical protein
MTRLTFIQLPYGRLIEVAECTCPAWWEKHWLVIRKRWGKTVSETPFATETAAREAFEKICEEKSK